MKTNKRVMTLLLALAIVLTLVPITKVQASVVDINIISQTQVTPKQAEEWAKSKGATDTFVSLAKLYWEYVSQHGGVNPGIAYAQAGKETGYGRFGGVLDESYNNPCGMKTSSGGGDYDANAHQRFNSWDEGVQAHLDHLALYAGASGYPRTNTYDPRHFATIKGKAPTVNTLGGNWAPSSTYGEEINTLYNDLLTFAGINNAQQNSSDNSTNISSSIGWKYESGIWYYYKTNGSKATGWIKPGNNWYYLKSNGEMAKGWLNVSGTWYYLNSNGAMKTSWLQISGKWYYFNNNGAMLNGWIKPDANWYYLYNNGVMATGWEKLGTEWYYLKSSGAMATGWQKLGSEWYYLKSSGVMAKGWLVDGKDNYYLNSSSGAMMKDTVIEGWQLGSDGKRGSKISSGSNSSGTKKLIVIDPGHNFGGNDGAYATHNRITYIERDLNMQVSIKLKAQLEARGYEVVMTRNEFDRETLGVTQSLTNRVNLANNLGADLFISVHHNASESSSSNGVETYYSTNTQDASFGGKYSDSKVSVSRNMSLDVTNSVANKTGLANRGAKNGNLFVCRNTNMPSILIEFGFITNPQEAIKCADENTQKLSTSAVANAVASNGEI